MYYNRNNRCATNAHWNQCQSYHSFHQPFYRSSGGQVDTTNFTPDEWVQYIEPLVQRALEEEEEGINLTHLFQEFILSGVLVGKGYTPEAAIELVEQWEKSGESQLLQQSKAMRWWW